MAQPSIDSQRAFYDRLWEHIPTAQLNNHEQARLQAITAALNRLDLSKDLAVLEVGCGRGWLSGLLLRHYGHVTAYDLAREPIAKARERFPDVDFACRDVLADPPDGAYDLVVSSEVLEHVPDARQFIGTLVDATRRSGHVLLTTPNARLRSNWESAGRGFTPQPIENWVVPRDLRRMLGERCVVCDAGTFFFDVGQIGIHRLISNRAARSLRSRFPQIERTLGSTDLGLYQYVVARRR